MNDKLNDIVNNFMPETKKNGTKTTIIGSFVKAGSGEIEKLRRENEVLKNELKIYKEKFNSWCKDESSKWSEKYAEMEHSFDIIIGKFKETAQERDKLIAKLVELESEQKIEKVEPGKAVGTSVAKLSRMSFTN